MSKYKVLHLYITQASLIIFQPDWYIVRINTAWSEIRLIWMINVSIYVKCHSFSYSIYICGIIQLDYDFFDNPSDIVRKCINEKLLTVRDKTFSKFYLRTYITIPRHF